MIEKIIPDRISLTLPTVFGEELTFLEFCGKVRAKLNECIDVVNENTSNIEDVTSKTNENTTNIQQNTTAISKNESDIVKLNGVINSISAQTDENTVSINTVSGKVDKNTTDIQQNTTDIQQNKSDIQQNTTDIQQNTTDIQQNTTAIRQNTTNISKNELSITEINAAFNILRTDFLKQKAESLFAPVILNVDPHSPGADINTSIYVRIGRISYDVLGCLYAKVNISFSGATDAKTLKILSVQFGKRSTLSLSDPAPIFTAKTDVINIPISVVGSVDIPVGTSDIAVTGLNFFGSSENISDISSAITLEYIPTGKDIPCDSLAFTSPAGGEEDSKLIYIFKASEGCFEIFTTAAGISGTSQRAYLQTDFTNVISDSKIFTQFLCSGGYYNRDTISTIPNNGVSLGAAMIDYTEYTEGSHSYNARITVNTLNYATGTHNSLKSTGIASQTIPFGMFAHTSLTFDLFR